MFRRLVAGTIMLVFLLAPGAMPGVIVDLAADEPHKPDFAGIWSISGIPESILAVEKEGKPWYKGAFLKIDWQDIEPQNSQFQWERLDKVITEVAGQGLYVMFIVNGSPDWLYQSGVPEFQTDFQGGTSYPYYLDPDYQVYLKRMIHAVANHIDTAYSPSIRSRIIAMQCPAGATGDTAPYKQGIALRRGGGRVFSFGEGQYSISASEWDSYTKEIFQVCYDAYKDTSPRIHTLYNVASSQSLLDWVVKELQGSWVKSNRIGDRYQNNREANDTNFLSWLPPIIGGFQPDGTAIRARSEMDLTRLGWFAEAPQWNMYWTQLWGLHNGQDIHNQTVNDLQQPEYYAAFAFYSQYAGYKDPGDSLGVWIALRDGLDAADTVRFPIDEYGPRKSPERFVSIADDFSAYGAKQSDPNSTTGSSWNGLNDVGWKIYTGNYQMYLYQHDPNGTSQGLWRQGPIDQDYGRFARRFDHASGKDTMYFDIDDGFFFNQPLNGEYPLTIRVVYLDQGTGRWALRYDAIADPQKTAFVVTKTNSGRWQEKVVEIGDGYFGNRAAHKTDLLLVNLDNEDDTFHMIELTRQSGHSGGISADNTDLDLPFIETPKWRMIRDGYHELVQSIFSP
jgi:hypothetical protein